MSSGTLTGRRPARAMRADPAQATGAAATGAAATGAHATGAHAPGGAADARPPAGTWTFLTNHAHVLLCLAAEPDVRLRDVAEAVGITERAVQHIVADLAAAGVVERAREGRRNRYTLHPEAPLRHPVEAHRQVADLMALAPAGLRAAGGGRG